MQTHNRWGIAIAGVVMQVALGAVYASGAYDGALHTIAGVMAISMLLPIIVYPPRTRSQQSRDWPGQVSHLPKQ